MKKILLSSIACATLMFASSAEYKYEVTPMISGAVTEGNTDLENHFLSGGLSVGFNQIGDSVFDQIELGFLKSLQDVDFDGVNRDTSVTRVFSNLIKEYPLNAKTSLYALVGAGVEIFDDEFANNEDGLFGNYGAGIKYKLQDNLALKFDLRHVIEADHGDNTLLYNFGIAMPFGEVTKPQLVKEEPVKEPVKKADSDNDGVIDENDKCPNSVPNAVVNSIGCEMDDDNDGVVNRLDQCPSTISNVKVDTKGCMTLVDLRINFDVDSSNIKDKYQPRLKEFATALNRNTKLKATIEAHTDSTGSKSYNKALSQRRAAATIDALSELDVDPKRLKAMGYGESKPVATNKTKEGRAKNRRVTAKIEK